LLDGVGDGVVVEGVPDVEEVDAGGAEDAAGLAHGRFFVGKEHDAVLADDGVEGGVVEGEGAGVGLGEREPGVVGEEAFGGGEHGLADVGGREMGGLGEGAEELACDDAGAAGELEDAGGLGEVGGAEAVREVAGVGLEEEGAEGVVVGFGDGAGEGGGGCGHWRCALSLNGNTAGLMSRDGQVNGLTISRPSIAAPGTSSV
jgi:hypothetical protein